MIAETDLQNVSGYFDAEIWVFFLFVCGTLIVLWKLVSFKTFQKRLALVINYLLAAGTIFVAYVFYRLFTFPENHSGLNVLWSIWIFVPLIFLSIWAFVRFRNSRWLWISAFAIAMSLLMVSIFYFNILLPYDHWSPGMVRPDVVEQWLKFK